jgi:hypothetical protein
MTLNEQIRKIFKTFTVLVMNKGFPAAYTYGAKAVSELVCDDTTNDATRVGGADSVAKSPAVLATEIERLHDIIGIPDGPQCCQCICLSVSASSTHGFSNQEDGDPTPERMCKLYEEPLHGFLKCSECLQREKP